MNAPFLTPGMASCGTLKPSTQWAKNVNDAWIIEHRIAIINGGANAEPNLCLSCSWCKPLKDAEDVAQKAKTYSVRSKHVLPAQAPKMQSRGFAKSAGQRKATSPITPKFPGDLLGTARKAR